MAVATFFRPVPVSPAVMVQSDWAVVSVALGLNTTVTVYWWVVAPAGPAGSIDTPDATFGSGGVPVHHVGFTPRLPGVVLAAVAETRVTPSVRASWSSRS